MKSITQLNLLNLHPTICISHEGLEAIKHIVSIAPQEAQWFQTITPVEYKSSPGEIYLHLSDKLYIPKQNTSLAQVDSSSSMMIEFYKELKEIHEQETVNDILKSMTCWCHSHHNMNPNPSNQDELQFNELIKLSQEQKQTTWQVMLIFNKKDQFYSRVYDPLTGAIFEGVDIVNSTSYDFEYIDKAAKTKFLKPKRIFSKKQSKTYSKQKPQPSNIFGSSIEDKIHSEWKDLNINNTWTSFPLEIAENLLEDIYHTIYSSMENKHFLSVLPKHASSKTVWDSLECHLDDRELIWLSFLCAGKKDKIKNVFSERQTDNYLNRYAEKPQEYIEKYLNNTSDTLACFEEKLHIMTLIPNLSSSSELEGVLL